MRSTKLPQLLQHFLSISEIKKKDIGNTFYYDFSLYVLNIVDKELHPIADLAGLCVLREIQAEDISIGIQSKIVAPDKLFIGTGSIKGILIGKDLKKILKKIPKTYIYKINFDSNFIISNVFNIIKFFI